MAFWGEFGKGLDSERMAVAVCAGLSVVSGENPGV